MKIYIALEKFPSLSETFILEHIVGLIENGCEVSIVSFFGKNEDVIHADIHRYSLLSKTKYINIPEERGKRIKYLLRVLTKYWFRILIFLKAFFIDWKGFYYAVNNVFKLVPFLEIGFYGSSYKVIHCHYGIYAKEYLFLKRIFPNVKFIVTFHLWDIRKGIKEGKGYYIDLFSIADYLIAISDWNKKKLLELGAPVEKIISIPNGINVEKFSCGNEVSKDENIVEILTVARLVEVKNLDFAIKAIRKLVIEENLNFIRYKIIGNGPLREKLNELVKEYGLSDFISLLGAKTSEYVAESMKKADIFFLPSTHEAFPTVLLEAGASCLPVVASDIAGVGEIVQNGNTGILFENNKIDLAVSALKELIFNADKRRIMGRKAREIISSRFGRKAIGKKFCDLYKGKL